MATCRTVLSSIGALTLIGLLPACDRQGPAPASRPPVAIGDGDECAVCGMTINNFPGPKGEAYVAGANAPLKFCSTRDLFAYLAQPEAEAVVREIYVHDMAATAWDAPAPSAFVAARSAWYVAGHPLKGAMGPTLASFKERAAAEAFAARYQGRVLGFAEITAEFISRLE